MASNTKQTKYRRRLRRAKMGTERKARARNQGTTPAFPIHTPDADANAPSEQLSPSQRDNR